MGVHTAKDLLSETEREGMVDQLAQTLNIPVFSEGTKRGVIKSFLDTASAFLETHLPSVVLAFLKGPSLFFGPKSKER